MGKPAGTVDTSTGNDTVLMIGCVLPKKGHKLADGVEEAAVSLPCELPDIGSVITTS